MTHENVKIRILERAEFFRDNIEHISALEKEARLWVVLAYIREKGGRVSALLESEEDPALHTVVETRGIGTEQPFTKAKAEFPCKKEGERLLAQTHEENNRLAKGAVDHGIPLKLEDLCQAHRLDEFERKVLILLLMKDISTRFRSLLRNCGFRDADVGNLMSAGDILSILTDSLEEQVRGRGYFSTDGTLMVNGLINFAIAHQGGLLDSGAWIHERVCRFILGDDTQYEFMSDYIEKEESAVRMEQVILPDAFKEDITRAVDCYTKNAGRRKALGMELSHGSGAGLVFLFSGPSGTGKTMLAKAIANRLGKPIFRLDMGAFRNNSISETWAIKQIFKEARLCDGMVFFDESDDQFGEGFSMSMALLVEIERSGCLTILATNKVDAMDPAIERRAAIRVVFPFPDERHRERIWSAMIPDGLKISGDVDFGRLAKEYVFTGGLIKNAVMMAVNEALGKGDGTPVITREDFEKAAESQAVNIFGRVDDEQVYGPEGGLESLILNERAKAELTGLVTAFRAGCEGINAVIFSRPVETGIDAANAVAHDCGLIVRKFSLGDILVKSAIQKVRDPVTQKEVLTLADYAFMKKMGRRGMLLFVDYDSDFGVISAKDDKKNDLCGFLAKLRANKGMVFIVSPLPKTILPAEFSCSVELGYPPEALQRECWRRHLAETACEDDVWRIVSRYPMDANEIEFIVSQARLRSFLSGSRGDIQPDILKKTLQEFRSKINSPVLFGGGKSCVKKD